jgi:hypothetical protein
VSAAHVGGGVEADDDDEDSEDDAKVEFVQGKRA